MRSSTRLSDRPIPRSHNPRQDNAKALSRPLAAAGSAPFEERLSRTDLYRRLGLQPDDAEARCTHEGWLNRTQVEPDAWWDVFPAAMSWVTRLIIEGFAAYGAAMQPGCFPPAETGEIGSAGRPQAGPARHRGERVYTGQTWYPDQWFEQSKF